jgi:hypothetical protein
MFLFDIMSCVDGQATINLGIWLLGKHSPLVNTSPEF